MFFFNVFPYLRNVSPYLSCGSYVFHGYCLWLAHYPMLIDYEVMRCIYGMICDQLGIAFARYSPIHAHSQLVFMCMFSRKWQVFTNFY